MLVIHATHRRYSSPDFCNSDRYGLVCVKHGSVCEPTYVKVRWTGTFVYPEACLYLCCPKGQPGAHFWRRFIPLCSPSYFLSSMEVRNPILTMDAIGSCCYSRSFSWVLVAEGQIVLVTWIRCLKVLSNVVLLVLIWEFVQIRRKCKGSFLAVHIWLLHRPPERKTI